MKPATIHMSVLFEEMALSDLGRDHFFRVDLGLRASRYVVQNISAFAAATHNRFELTLARPGDRKARLMEIEVLLDQIEEGRDPEVVGDARAKLMAMILDVR